MAYIEEPENTVYSISLDIPVYNPDTDSKCRTPQVLAWYVEGSEQVLVGADLLLEGIEVSLNTGETGIINDGVAIINLESPLIYGDEIWAEINTESCKAKSCSVYVSRVASLCIQDPENMPSGELTGRLVCVEKNMYREVYDGDGGFTAEGVLAQEDCIYCGGNLPNCEEPPTEPTTFYNIVSCQDGSVYQTTTVLTVSNQRVSHPIHGLHRWNGTTQTTAPNFRGEVSILVGETGCPAVTTYYNIVKCADGSIKQTPTVITINNQLVSHGTGEHRWNGTTTTTPTDNIGTVVIMVGQFACN